MSREDIEIKDSGQRRNFDTGSVRDTDDAKGAFHLLPFHALLEYARHMRDGADKYGWRNWEKGQPVASYLNSAIRHLYEYLAGYRDEPHLRAAAWNVMGALETREQVRRGRLPEELMEVTDEDEYGLREPLDADEEPIVNGDPADVAQEGGSQGDDKDEFYYVKLPTRALQDYMHEQASLPAEEKDTLSAVEAQRFLNCGAIISVSHPATKYYYAKIDGQLHQNERLQSNAWRNVHGSSHIEKAQKFNNDIVIEDYPAGELHPVGEEGDNPDHNVTSNVSEVWDDIVEMTDQAREYIDTHQLHDTVERIVTACLDHDAAQLDTIRFDLPPSQSRVSVIIRPSDPYLRKAARAAVQLAYPSRSPFLI